MAQTGVEARQAFLTFSLCIAIGYPQTQHYNDV